jgi:ArsR family transcriptional regulator, arsenate/arsenite/antimonite-responsive transcriptional repressor
MTSEVVDRGMCVLLFVAGFVAGRCIDRCQYIPAAAVVNIESCRYSGDMNRTLDPDVRLLQALADPTRLAIVRQLAADSEVCACDFTACCSVSQPTVSHHLRVLREAGLVTSERRGTWIYYQLQPAAVERLGEIARGLTAGGSVSASDLRRGRSGLGAPPAS